MNTIGPLKPRSSVTSFAGHLCISTLLSWAVVCIGNSQEAVAPSAIFSTASYHGGSGGPIVRLISDSELEISQSSGNLVCNYSKRAGVMRVLIADGSTLRSHYWRVLEDKLVTDDGKALFSFDPKTETIALANTRFSIGYSPTAFSTIKPGMTGKEVFGLVGIPLVC